MTPPIVFVDTETTGLGPAARPWEIAMIRRDPDGSVREYVAQIAYTLKTLPPGTTPEALHVGGWLTRGAPGTTYLNHRGEPSSFRYRDERDAALDLTKFFAEQPVLVGVGVHFDAQVLAGMFGRAGVTRDPWHYGLVDLKAAAWGTLHSAIAGGVTAPHMIEATRLPLRSEQLAAACGVAPPSDDERHTALGDARWAARWFDALLGAPA